MFGDEGVVEFAFGGFGFGGVLGAGASPFGHHHSAVAVVLHDGWFTVPQGRGGCVQLWEQVQAARVGDIGVPGRTRPDDGAIG